jgi:tRNA(fMet)-specific endonuclease VapC
VGRRLILDTNVLIAHEGGTIDRAALDNDELAVAAITIAEYRAGIELADTAERAASRSRALVAIESVVDGLAYTDATAIQHARLIAHVRRAGTPCGAHDLIIAAHAGETGRTVLTRDLKAGSAGLPGVLAIDTP